MGRLSWSSKCARRGGALVLGASVLLSTHPAAADEAPPSKEIWAGAEVTVNTWSVYSGITAALYGPLEADGWRIRAVGGYGAYSYPKDHVTIRGYSGFADLLVGYQQQFGSVTLKGFAGVAAENHTLLPFDPDSDVVGDEYGAKTVLETWWTITPEAWTSLDLSWSSLYGGTYAMRARAGYQLNDGLSAGFEVTANGNPEYRGNRGGAFFRFAWSHGEVSASVGAAVDRSGELGGYGTVNALFKY